MKLYHGTNSEFTNKLQSKLDIIDVSIGRGELGKGFYTSPDCGLVSIWAYGKHKEKASIIEFTLDEFEYMKLDIHMIKLRSEVRDIYFSDQHKIFNVDVVEGPYWTIESRIQHKFESRKSEILLNKSISRINEISK